MGATALHMTYQKLYINSYFLEEMVATAPVQALPEHYIDSDGLNEMVATTLQTPYQSLKSISILEKKWLHGPCASLTKALQQLYLLKEMVPTEPVQASRKPYQSLTSMLIC